MGVRGLVAAVAASQLILFVFCAGALASPACPGDDLQPALTAAADTASAALCDLNDVRAQNGLPPMNWDSRLAAAAQTYAEDMATQHFFGHVAPNGTTLADRVAPTGYIPDGPSWTLSENLGFGTSTLAPPAAMTLGWMNSAPHRENMLDPDLEDVGIGIAQGAISDGGETGTIYVVDFGVRRTALDQPGTAVGAPRAARHRRYRRAHGKSARARRRRARARRGHVALPSRAARA